MEPEPPIEMADWFEGAGVPIRRVSRAAPGPRPATKAPVCIAIRAEDPIGLRVGGQARLGAALVDATLVRIFDFSVACSRRAASTVLASAQRVLGAVGHSSEHRYYRNLRRQALLDWLVAGDGINAGLPQVAVTDGVQSESSWIPRPVLDSDGEAW
jgi:hypothetical protein